MSEFLVLGCGSIGRRHTRNLLELGITDVAVFDPDEVRRTQTAAEYGVQAIANPADAYMHGVRAVFVCSPPVYHIPQALEAVAAGAHIFVEKPLAASMDGVDKLARAVRERGVVSLVGCNFRFAPGLKKLKSLIDDGELGRVISARAEFGQYLPDWHPWEDYRAGYSARRELGGGIVLDRIHELDYLTWLMGGVSEIQGFAAHASSLEIDTEDVADIFLRFTSGAFGYVHVDYIRRSYQCRCQIVGEQGVAEWDFADRSLRWYSAVDKQWRNDQWPDYDVNTMYLDQFSHFLRAIARQEPSMCTIEEGARVLQLALDARDGSKLSAILR